MQRIASATMFVLLIGSITSVSSGKESDATLRVMSFNMWHGGEASGQPFEHTRRVVEASGADIVGLQETHGQAQDGTGPDNAKRLADELGWHFFDQGNSNAVVSRYPIVAHTPQKHGVKLDLPTGEHVWLFNVHLAHAPYQPYQLLKIPYAEAPFLSTPSEAVAAATAARGHQIAAMLEEVQAIDKRDLTFVTGDFNEPSSLDWTEAVFHAGRCPCIVDWPTTRSVINAGFADAYRAINPDPVKQPGYTWTSITAEDDPRDRHDRIDFVFVRGAKAKITNANIVGERPERADIVVTPYPSDHRAVVITVTID